MAIKRHPWLEASESATPVGKGRSVHWKYLALDVVVALLVAGRAVAETARALGNLLGGDVDDVDGDRVELGRVSV